MQPRSEIAIPEDGAGRTDLRRFVADVLLAFVIGLVPCVPIAIDAWNTPPPRTITTHFVNIVADAPPPNDDALRAWFASRTDLRLVSLRRFGTATASIVATWEGRQLAVDDLPLASLGYSETQRIEPLFGSSEVTPVFDIGCRYYVTLLAACANLGYLVLGVRRVRRSGRWATLFARPSARTAVGSLASGALLGGAILLWAKVPGVGGTTAGGFASSTLWPDPARIALACMLPFALPLAQETFFRGIAPRPVVAIAAVFALVQLWPTALVPAFVASLLFAWLRLRTAGLWAPMLANAAFVATSITLPLLGWRL